MEIGEQSCLKKPPWLSEVCKIKEMLNFIILVRFSDHKSKKMPLNIETKHPPFDLPSPVDNI